MPSLLLRSRGGTARPWHEVGGDRARGQEVRIVAAVLEAGATIPKADKTVSQALDPGGQPPAKYPHPQMSQGALPTQHVQV